MSQFFSPPVAGTMRYGKSTLPPTRVRTGTVLAMEWARIELCKRWASLGCAMVLCGCAASPATGAGSAEAPSAATVEATSPLPHILSALIAAEPHPDAPAELRQYGQLVGTWSCKTSSRQQDGTWKDNPTEATWTWFYSLNGHAVQDVWQSPPSTAGGPGGIGTNLRVYDPEAKRWDIAWTTAAQRQFDRFTAVYQGGAIEMRGDLPARSPFPALSAKITFYSITDASFDWKYEGTALGSDTGWNEFSRIHCSRVASGLAAPPR